MPLQCRGVLLSDLSRTVGAMIRVPTLHGLSWQSSTPAPKIRTQYGPADCPAALTAGDYRDHRGKRGGGNLPV